MVNCKSCGKEISKGAVCPHCGRNNTNLFLRIFLKHPILYTLGILLVIGFLQVVMEISKL